MASTLFEVDRRGLAKLVAGRKPEFIMYELLQNAWDQNTTKVQVWIRRVEELRMTTEIVVEDDDPDGFADLRHAYTLFAESSKKSDPTQRGRFNIGEKLVFALAERGKIETTKGTIEFEGDRRIDSRRKREAGSRVTVQVKMALTETQRLIDGIHRVIVPPNRPTMLNDVLLPIRKAVAEFEASLPTVISDSEGVMHPAQRKTVIRVYEPLADEEASIYEMGIPVVDTGDKYHVDVQQKVPLNMDRDNVTPAYLRTVRVAVLNATSHLLEATDVVNTWVREACSDERVQDAAVRSVIWNRFGGNAVAYDPSDKEANNLSVADGRPIVHGGHLSRDEWAMVKRAGVLPPAGTITPSPKPFSPDGTPLTLIINDEWTDGMNRVADFAKDMGCETLRRVIAVNIAREPSWPVVACYGKIGVLTFNYCKLGREFFECGITQRVIDLIIHEFGHEYEGNHLSSDYYDALTRLGAQFTLLALRKPELFK